jgi:hypothetical protein
MLEVASHFISLYVFLYPTRSRCNNNPLSLLKTSSALLDAARDREIALLLFFGNPLDSFSTKVCFTLLKISLFLSFCEIHFFSLLALWPSAPVSRPPSYTSTLNDKVHWAPILLTGLRLLQRPYETICWEHETKYY